MNSKSFKVTLSIIVISLTALAFQNCGESLDLSGQLGQSSLATGVSFSSSTNIGTENNTYQLSAVITNLSDYTIQWYKDDVLIEGEVSDAINFSSLEFTDRGEYEAVVTTADTEYRSGKRLLQVRVDPTEPLEVVVTTPMITATIGAANLEFLVYGFTARVAAEHEAIMEDYCQHRYGAQATATDYAFSNTIMPTDKYAFWYPNGTTCTIGGNIRAQGGPNFCLIDVTTTFNLARYDSVTCNRYPDYIAPQ